MKGIVFTEFLEMVEDRFGYETANRIVEDADLPSKGIYTTIGTYDHQEMVDLVSNLSNYKDIPTGDLFRIYGEHLFGIFIQSYPQFFQNNSGLFDFLEKLEDYIHPEVRKLYPDAELPRFQSERKSDTHLEMIYRSKRSMSDFAEGLMLGAIKHFDQRAIIRKDYLSEDGSVVKFNIEIKE